jgi:hypothetical protein
MTTNRNIDPTSVTTARQGIVIPEDVSTPNNTMHASKLQTDCQQQHRNSLQCIQDNYENKDIACQKYFDLYKECRKNEHASILEKRIQQQQQQKSSSSFSFW